MALLSCDMDLLRVPVTDQMLLMPKCANVNKDTDPIVGKLSAKGAVGKESICLFSDMLACCEGKNF